MSSRPWWRRFGPAWLVTAAFIGPGTVATASKAGASHGTELAWAIVFAIIAAFVLQEMAARLGLVTRRDLGDVLVNGMEKPWARFLAAVLILGAILVGNAAYQAGNLAGAAIGLSHLTGLSSITSTLVLAAAALALIWFSVYRTIQAVLITLVALMSLVFLFTAVQVWPLITSPPPSSVPRDSAESSITLIIALVGTTVVPYNLFLHARSVQERCPHEEDLTLNLRASRADAAIAIAVGGAITAAILMTSAAAFYYRGQPWGNLDDMARQLRPVAGAYAESLFAVGLAAAGLTSAITAPLAAGLAASGCLNWNASWSDLRFKFTACAVVLAGLASSLLFGDKAFPLILFAQAANGVLLPLITAYLLFAMNRKATLGRFTNTWRSNLLGAAVLVVVCILSLSALTKVARQLLT